MELGKSKIDQSLVAQGVWTDFILMGASEPVEISLRLALAHAGQNAAYKAALQKALDPFERLLSVYKSGKDIPAPLAKKINDVGRRVFCEQIVLDWKGPTKNGQPRAYTPEGGLELFEEYPELMAQAEAEAGKFERYRISLLEDAAGNSASA
jgi:hypothetical protein